MRKCCNECPWKRKDKHSLQFRERSVIMNGIGVNQHACHMISTDIWGLNVEINDKNICLGQKKINK